MEEYPVTGNIETAALTLGVFLLMSSCVVTNQKVYHDGSLRHEVSNGIYGNAFEVEVKENDQ